MRFIRLLFLIVVAICLVTVALANRGLATIKLLPEEMAAYLGQPLSYDVPLFAIIFASIAVGLLIGFVWEYLREHKHRVAARTERSSRERLERELKSMRRGSGSEDEILALLEKN